MLSLLAEASPIRGSTSSEGIQLILILEFRYRRWNFKMRNHNLGQTTLSTWNYSSLELDRPVATWKNSTTTVYWKSWETQGRIKGEIFNKKFQIVIVKRCENFTERGRTDKNTFRNKKILASNWLRSETFFSPHCATHLKNLNLIARLVSTSLKRLTQFRHLRYVTISYVDSGKLDLNF